MKLTTRGRYAVTAMLDLAIHAGQGPVALAEISQRQHISLSYLEQLFANLRKSGLVKSTRGPGGGYGLTTSDDEVVISDIIEAVNESVDSTNCGGSQNCHDGHRCLTHDLWAGLNTQIEQYFSGISLADLIGRTSLQSISFRRNPRPAGKPQLAHAAGPQHAND